MAMIFLGILVRQTLNHITQIGKIVAARRRAVKISQQALAEKLGISQNYLSEIESGTKKLSAQRLLEIANVLGLELVIQSKQRLPHTDW